MNESELIELQVMNWYRKNYNGPIFPFFKRQVITLETSLSTGKYPWADEDAIDIIEDYFSRFSIEKKNFSFLKYWPNEEVFMPLNFLRSKENKWKWTEPEPLTLKMLVESAQAGYWLYD